MDTIEKLWRIELDTETNDISLTEFQVIRETEDHFVCGPLLAESTHISKLAVDRLPSTLNGGTWYSSQVRALVEWHKHHQDESISHQEILKKIQAKLKEVQS